MTGVICDLNGILFRRKPCTRGGNIDLLQKDVAAYLKCTQVCYSNYETGKRDIPTEVLIQLAHLYHTSTDYILGLDVYKRQVWYSALPPLP